jgi:arsenite/tail-anchored protein-transporting ATPase
VSNRSRLILLSGLGGAGTSTLAAATVDALRVEGHSAVLIDASGSVPPDPGLVTAVSATLGRVMTESGADPVLARAWSSLGAVSQLSALAAALRSLGEADAVVVDAGSLVRARELLDLPAVLVRLLDSVLTPRTAMWRPGGEPVFEAWSAARADAVRLLAMIRHPRTTIRVVTRPTRDGIEPALRAASAFALLGVGVDAIVVNRFPRDSEGWPKDVRRQARAALDELEASADGMAVWKSTARIRPVPKNRSAMGPLGRVHSLDEDQLHVTVADEGFHLDLPLVGPAPAEAEVGRQGESLVIAFDDVVRWIDLPPVLRRCRAVCAIRSTAGMRVVFEPDETVWRQPAEAS